MQLVHIADSKYNSINSQGAFLSCWLVDDIVGTLSKSCVIVLEVYANKKFNKNIQAFLYLDKVKFLFIHFDPLNKKITCISLNGI